jgi:tetratricopeptide (TPR) repeat protein
VLYDAGEHAAALPHAEAAVRLEPQVAEHYVTLAMVQARLGDQEAALATTRAGLAADPASERLKKTAVVIYFLFDQADKALQQLAYWSNAPRQSPAFLQAAIDLALSAGKPAYAEALRAHLSATRDSVLDAR